MRRFILQVLANAVAITLTVWLMPGLILYAYPLQMVLVANGYDSEELTWYWGALNLLLLVALTLLLGLIYTLIDRYIKPLLLGLTHTLIDRYLKPLLPPALGRVFVWSYAISVLIVNIVVFWVFVHLFGNLFLIGGREWVRIVLGGILLSIFGTAVEVLFGINRPRKQVDWRVVERLPMYDKLQRFATQVAEGNDIIANIRARSAPAVLPREDPAEDGAPPDAAPDHPAAHSPAASGASPTLPEPPAPDIALSGSQRKSLCAALEDAFDPDSLAQMVGFHLETRLSSITHADNLKTDVYNLVIWAEQTGNVRKLIHGALQENHTNPKLRTFADSIGLPQP